MEHTARNYHAHGGSEWVVGGKLTFLPGATVEGAEGLFDLPRGEGCALPYRSAVCMARGAQAEKQPATMPIAPSSATTGRLMPSE